MSRKNLPVEDEESDSLGIMCAITTSLELNDTHDKIDEKAGIS